MPSANNMCDVLSQGLFLGGGGGGRGGRGGLISIPSLGIFKPHHISSVIQCP